LHDSVDFKSGLRLLLPARPVTRAEGRGGGYWGPCPITSGLRLEPHHETLGLIGIAGPITNSYSWSYGRLFKYDICGSVMINEGLLLSIIGLMKGYCRPKPIISSLVYLVTALTLCLAHNHDMDSIPVFE